MYENEINIFLGGVVTNIFPRERRVKNQKSLAYTARAIKQQKVIYGTRQHKIGSLSCDSAFTLRDVKKKSQNYARVASP